MNNSKDDNLHQAFNRLLDENKKLQSANQILKTSSNKLFTQLEQAKSHLMEASSLNALIEELSQEIDLNSLLEKFQEYLNARYGFESLILSLSSPGEKEFYIKSILLSDQEDSDLDLYLNKDYKVYNEPSFIGECIKTKKMIYVHEDSQILEDNIFDQSLMSSLNIKSVSHFPILAGSETLGVLSFINHNKNFALSQSEIKSVERMIRHLALLIRNIRLYEQINEEKTFSTGLIEHSPIAIHTINRDGLITIENEAMRKINGDIEGKFLNKNIFDLPSVYNSDFKEIYERALKGVPYNSENVLFDFEFAGRKYLNISITPIFKEGWVESVLTMYYDNTKKALAEGELKRLYNLTFLLNSTLEKERILNLVFEEILEFFDFDTMIFLKPDLKKQEIIAEHILFSGNKIEKSIKDEFKNICFPLNKKGGHVFRVYESKNSVYSPAYAETNHLLDKAVLKSEMILPVEIQGNVEAIIILGCFDDMELDSRDIQKLRVLINHMSSALHHSMLYHTIDQKRIKLQEAQTIIDADMKMAKRIQTKLFSKESKEIDALKIHVHFQPMMEVGGDIYDIFKLRENYYRIFLADATGHGVPAALTTMIIKTEYEKIKSYNFEPHELLKIFNNEFVAFYYQITMFFTCVLVDIDLEEGKIYYSSAAHPTQYLIHSDKTVKLHTKGKMIGIIENSEYLLQVENFVKKDKLLLFTDGLFEEFSGEDEEYGSDRLEELIKENRSLEVKELVQKAIEDVDSFRGNNKNQDDVTCIGIYYPF